MTRSDGRKHGTDAPLWFSLAEPTFNSQVDLPEGITDGLANKIASSSFQHSSFAVFKQFLKRRQLIRWFSNPDANPIDFEIRKEMKSRRKACHCRNLRQPLTQRAFGQASRLTATKTTSQGPNDERVFLQHAIILLNL